MMWNLSSFCCLASEPSEGLSRFVLFFRPGLCSAEMVPGLAQTCRCQCCRRKQGGFGIAERKEPEEGPQSLPRDNCDQICWLTPAVTAQHLGGRRIAMSLRFTMRSFFKRINGCGGKRKRSLHSGLGRVVAGDYPPLEWASHVVEQTSEHILDMRSADRRKQTAFRRGLK